MNIELQIIGSGLRAIAEEMGAVLVRSAFSANIKERRDCSTALFDRSGRILGYDIAKCLFWRNVHVVAF